MNSQQAKGLSKSLAYDRMIKIKFNDAAYPAGYTYSAKVLRLRCVLSPIASPLSTICSRNTAETPTYSSVLNTGLALAQSDTVDLSDKRCPMLALLNLMKAAVDPTQKLTVIGAEHVTDFIALADKYDVVTLAHPTYSLTIIKALDHQTEENNFSALVYAIKSKDEWLCKHIIRRTKLGDPAQWSKVRTDILGYEAWFALVNAFPRTPTSSADGTKWTQIADKVQWAKLL
jgi:hypothetical protein